MPLFSFHTLNSELQSQSEPAEYPSVEHAFRDAVRGAVTMAGDEAAGGAMSSSVIVTIKSDEGREVTRLAVAVSVAPLTLGGLTG